MWIALWSVLVIGAIVVPVLLALGLWRRVKALGHEFAAFADALVPHTSPEAAPQRSHPTLLEPGTSLRVRETARANRLARAGRRESRVRSAIARWTAQGLV